MDSLSLLQIANLLESSVEAKESSKNILKNLKEKNHYIALSVFAPFFDYMGRRAEKRRWDFTWWDAIIHTLPCKRSKISLNSIYLQRKTRIEQKRIS